MWRIQAMVKQPLASARAAAMRSPFCSLTAQASYFTDDTKIIGTFSSRILAAPHKSDEPRLATIQRKISTKERTFATSKAGTPSSAERTAQIISHATTTTPIGSLTSEQWNESIQNLINISTRSARTEDVQKSFWLLQRLVQECMVNQTLSPTDKALSNDVLQKVVLSWQSWRKLNPTAQELGPEEVLTLVDNFTIRVPAMQPGTRIYNAIMAAFTSTEGKDPKECAQRVQELFDRIAEPTSKSYETLMQVHIQAGEIKTAIDIMDRVLEATKKNEVARFGSPILEAALAACVNAKHKRGGLLAEDILDRMHKFYNAGIVSEKPNIRHHTSAINAWAKSNHPQAGENAERVLQYLRESELHPDTIIYNTAMDAWAKQGNPEQADRLLMEMHDQYFNGNKHVKPDIQSFTILVDAHAKSRTHDSGIKAEHCLQLMWKLHATQGMDCKPNAQSYNCVMDAWAGSGNPEAGSRAENVFREMLQRSETDCDLAPTTVSVTILANALVKAGNVDRAGSVVHNMCLQYEQGIERLRPNVQTFNIIIDGIARKRGINAGRKAEELLRKMEKLGVPPNAVSYTSTIHAWSQSGERKAGQAATRLLREMLERARDCPDIKPDVKLYSSAIDAWAKSGHQTAGIEAGKLLREMVVTGRDDPDVKPNATSFNSVINAWAKSGHRNAGVEAEKLLREMVVKGREDPEMKPAVTSFSSAINAWARSGNHNAGVEAERLLCEMMAQARDNPQMNPNVTSFNSAIDAWAKSGHRNAGIQAERLLCEMIVQARINPGMKPDATSFNSVINAWAKSGHHNAGVEAEKLLREMVVKGRGDPDMKPDATSFCSAINAWARSGHHNAGVEAEKLLREMMVRAKDNPDAKPNVTSFSSAINAWARSGHPNAGVEAEKLLREMIVKGSKNPDMKPNVRSYASAINAWASGGNFESAENLLLEMVNSKDRATQPNVISFNSVINALSKSHQSNKGERADQYLRDMETLQKKGMQNIRPDLATYMTVLKCWSLSQDNPRAKRRVKDLDSIIEGFKKGGGCR